MSNIDEDLLEVIDLLNFTFSTSFIDKWSYKYGKGITRIFQLKILKSLEKRKPLKVRNILKILIEESGYKKEIVKSFLEDIDYEIYRPIITGNLETDIEEF